MSLFWPWILARLFAQTRHNAALDRAKSVKVVILVILVILDVASLNNPGFQPSPWDSISSGYMAYFYPVLSNLSAFLTATRLSNPEGILEEERQLWAGPPLKTLLPRLREASEPRTLSPLHRTTRCGHG